MEKANKKIFLVMWESNVNEENLFDVIPCRTLISAREQLKANIKEILGHGHFMRADKEDCTIEKDDNSYFITDETDDFWEYTYIRAKELIG